MFPTVPADEAADDEPTSPVLGTVRARVLVAEDDSALRALIVARLEREGFEVVEVGSGGEALELLKLSADAGVDDLDLIVMDHRMPGSTGLEIARMLRLAAWRIPVVMITAFPDWDLVVEAARLDVAVVSKPFAMDCLSDAAIAALLQSTRSSSDWFERIV